MNYILHIQGEKYKHIQRYGYVFQRRISEIETIYMRYFDV